MGQECACLIEGHAHDAGVQHDVVEILVGQLTAEQVILELFEQTEADHGDLAIHEVAVDVEGRLDAVAERIHGAGIKNELRSGLDVGGIKKRCLREDVHGRPGRIPLTDIYAVCSGGNCLQEP